MRVRDPKTGTVIPMEWAHRYGYRRTGRVWVCGVNKDILKSCGFEVLECKRINMIIWAYLISKKEFKNYLVRHNLPHLLFKF